MLVLPTSARSAIIFEQSLGSPLWALFGYVTIAMLFASAYCAWEMVLSSLLGRRPRRSRWVVLATAVGLFASGVAVEATVNASVVFNDKLETTWGFVLSPWFFVLFIPCVWVLVALRVADSRKAGAFARVPGTAWWCAGLLLVAGYGVAALWSGGRSASIEAAALAVGVVLALASVVTLAVVAYMRRGSRGVAHAG